MLHLFTEESRQEVLQICANLVKSKGILYFVVFSDNEVSYGKGKEIEPNTFESIPGRPVHYFTAKDLKSQFHDFTVLKTGEVKEEENHGHHGEHIHELRYIIVQKQD